jgi:peptidoglycan/xylan/chitin deacetylase (PgdA/CDA1 family)
MKSRSPQILGLIAGLTSLVCSMDHSVARAQEYGQAPLVDYWPEGITGTVSLTFDDGLPSQLARAVLILNGHGLTGTFYVNAGLDIDWTVQEELWRPVGAAGHELGNHAFRHPCSCNHTWIARDLCLDNR